MSHRRIFGTCCHSHGTKEATHDNFQLFDILFFRFHHAEYQANLVGAGAGIKMYADELMIFFDLCHFAPYIFFLPVSLAHRLGMW